MCNFNSIPNDGRPTEWSFKGGRHNQAYRYLGRQGLWYIVEFSGSGRYENIDGIHVFPNSARIGGYAGSLRNRLFTDALLEKRLMFLSLAGGKDHGKGADSKGGFRAATARTVSFDGQPFETSLLADPDRIFREVLGIEPTPEAVKAWGEAREAALEAAEKAKEEQRAQREAEWKAQREAEVAARAQAKVQFEAVFGGEFDLKLPRWYRHEITYRGLEVWQDRPGTTPSLGHRYNLRVLKTPQEYALWYEETWARVAQEEAMAAERALQQQQWEVERKAREEAEAAENAAVANHLDKLDDLLSDL